MKRGMSLLVTVCLIMALFASGASATATYYTASTPTYNCSDAQLSNITRAMMAIDGIYIPYGGSFSFNDTVGPRTKAAGYVSAINGRGVSVVGGGVSQVATTMYLALLQIPGIYYSDVQAYGKKFTGGYVTDGSLAVVTDYAAGDDFAFTNEEGDMEITFWLNRGYLYCEVAVDYSGTDDTGYKDTLISSSSIPLSGSNGLKSNITRASNSVYGTVLYSGDTFSFNDVVGPRTDAYGYVSATNGRGVKVTGGGVAQVASVIWLGVKDLSCIRVTEKSTYGNRYNQNYVDDPADAIVTDYSAGTDFCFRYTGSGTLTIYVYVTDYDICCEIYEGSYLSW